MGRKSSSQGKGDGALDKAKGKFNEAAGAASGDETKKVPPPYPRPREDRFIWREGDIEITHRPGRDGPNKKPKKPSREDGSDERLSGY